MSDLIDRQAAIGEICALCHDICETGRCTLTNRIRLLPSAQPETIYCGDCKYGILDSSFPHQWFCKFKGDEWNNSDYFCGHAKRREVTT